MKIYLIEYVLIGLNHNYRIIFWNSRQLLSDYIFKSNMSEMKPILYEAFYMSREVF